MRTHFPFYTRHAMVFSCFYASVASSCVRGSINKVKVQSHKTRRGLTAVGFSPDFCTNLSAESWYSKDRRVNFIVFICLILAIGSKNSLEKGLGTQYRDVSEMRFFVSWY